MERTHGAQRSSAEHESAEPSADRGLRLIYATWALDRVFDRLSRLRSVLILALASDALLDRFNASTYSASHAYEPGSSDFRRQLFPWEESVIARFFPPPPARVLVGGAGAGREPLQLSAAGYEVVAFDPAPDLVERMAAEARAEGSRVTAYLGDYERLPHLTRAADRTSADLHELGPFDAAVLGWGSFSHIRTHAARVKTLETIARVTRGPILASFIALRPEDDGAAAPGALRRLLLSLRGRDANDDFSMYMGFQHRTNAAEVRALAREAGLEILELEFAGGETLAPYVVLRGRSLARDVKL